MEEIPEDVRETAKVAAQAVYADAFLVEGVCGDGFYLDSEITTDIIARAILAERERAARIVGQYSDHPEGAVAFVADEIAVAIRSGAYP